MKLWKMAAIGYGVGAAVTVATSVYLINKVGGTVSPSKALTTAALWPLHIPEVFGSIKAILGGSLNQQTGGGAGDIAGDAAGEPTSVDA